MSSDKKTSDDDKKARELREKLKSLDLTEEQRQWIESMLEEDEEGG
ncbi:hypothetical protein [Enterobacter sp. MALB-1]